MPPELPSELSTESGLRPPEDLISDTEIKPLDVENEGKIQETETEVVAEEEEVKAPEEPQLTPEEEEAIRKQIAIEMRKAELRARMEAASKARRAKKGFMTPERKKKLRLLLRRKAAEELKKEQEQKALQRQWIIEDRCGDPEDLEWASKDDLMDICEDYYQRIWECEGEKWDLEYEIRKRAYEIAELSSKVNDLRGKFQKPILKKVSKYENKFSLLQRKAAEYNYRNQLKMVKRPEFILKDLEDKKKHGDKKGDEAEEAADATRDQETPVPEETSEDGAEKKEAEGLGEGEEGKLPEGVEGEITAEGAAVLEGEPRLDGDEEARLEGEGAPQPNTEDTPRLEGEQGVEGEQLGGQSPDGEVQPTEPQPPPPPVHTEEDLWLYLKETVTSVHPSTVEEFVQNLIGTLQHVPEEYLKPVIEANIKRAASPCVLDGEQPVAQDGTLLVEEGQEAPPDGSAPTESSESETAVAGEVSEVTTEVAGDAVVSEVPAEVPEEPATTEEVTDGFSIVEATA
uniref:Uncharacterized protein n=1 Tax=Homalodisca liturata TaxID=320908 RepID=A0A1B6JU10_9HEMI